jgi:glycine oxidase
VVPADAATWLDPDAARRLEPSLPTSIHGALLVERHGYVAVPQLTEALTWAALRHGVAIETGRRIVHISGTSGSLELRADDGTQWGAESVVVATGSWAGQSGIAEPALQYVRPIRGQLVKLTWPGDSLRHVLWGPECYVVPWRDGSILVGATVEDVGFDERTTAAGVRDLLDAVCELLPAAWGAGFREARAGLRPATPDGLPLVGPSASVPGVTFAAGHFRNGVLLAPLTALLVADLVLEGRSDPALQVLNPARFI